MTTPDLLLTGPEVPARLGLHSGVVVRDTEDGQAWGSAHTALQDGPPRVLWARFLWVNLKQKSGN